MLSLKTKELSSARDVIRSVCREIRLSFSRTWLIHTRRFRDKRDISIHRQPVVPTTSTGVTLTARVGSALHLRVTNAQGEVVQEVSVGDA
jgi:hypothetical protein